MAKLECDLHGSLLEIESAIDEAVSKSVSASVEDESYCKQGDCACSVKVYERYSYIGGNRVSLSVTLFACKEKRAPYGDYIGRKSGGVFQDQHFRRGSVS